MKKKQELYICGNSKSPSTATIGMYEVFALELVLDLDTYEILDASCILVTDLGRNFIKSLLVGRNIKDDADEIIEDIKLYYQAAPQKALISAFKVACNRFKQYLEDYVS